MLFQLPSELKTEIFQYDNTYKDYIQQVVLIEMISVLQKRALTLIERMGNDYSKIYTFLVSDSINPRLLAYDPKFHAIDRKFFNYYFMRRRWTE
jgi:hypothetical protein